MEYWKALAHPKSWSLCCTKNFLPPSFVFFFFESQCNVSKQSKDSKTSRQRNPLCFFQVFGFGSSQNWNRRISVFYQHVQNEQSSDLTLTTPFITPKYIKIHILFSPFFGFFFTSKTVPCQLLITSRITALTQFPDLTME